jgi:hypothetical protein
MPSLGTLTTILILAILAAFILGRRASEYFFLVKKFGVIGRGASWWLPDVAESFRPKLPPLVKFLDTSNLVFLVNKNSDCVCEKV